MHTTHTYLYPHICIDRPCAAPHGHNFKGRQHQPPTDVHLGAAPKGEGGALEARGGEVDQHGERHDLVELHAELREARLPVHVVGPQGSAAGRRDSGAGPPGYPARLGLRTKAQATRGRGRGSTPPTPPLKARSTVDARSKAKYHIFSEHNSNHNCAYQPPEMGGLGHFFLKKKTSHALPPRG